MASWCLLTGQPAQTYMTLTRLDREIFADVAAEAARRRREG